MTEPRQPRQPRPALPPARRFGAVPLFVLVALALSGYRAWLIVHLGLDPYVDEAYYWGWAQDLDWGYYSKPPLIAVLIAASQWLWGDTLLALKAPSLILYPATAILIQMLGRRLFGERIGFWSGAAFLTLPLVSGLGLFISTDAPLVFLWALGMLLLWRALERPSGGLWLAIGAVAGLGLLAKYTMAAFIGSAFFALLLDPRGRAQLLRPAPWIGLIVALALFAPNLWWNQQNGFPTFHHTAEITRLDRRGWHPADFAEFLGAQWLSFGFVLSFGLVAALVRLFGLVREPRYRFLLAFTLPLLALVGVQALTGRANGNWGAPTFVGATLVTLGFLGERGRWRLAGAAIAFNCVLALAVYHWPDLLRATGTEMTRSNDPFKRARGWRELAEGVAPYLDAHHGAVLVCDDRELLAQLIYVLHPKRHARWDPPGGPVKDQYALKTPLTAAETAPVLFVSERAAPDDVTARFARADKLGDIDVRVHRNFRRKASVWLLQGFQGY